MKGLVKTKSSNFTQVRVDKSGLQFLLLYTGQVEIRCEKERARQEGGDVIGKMGEAFARDQRLAHYLQSGEMFHHHQRHFVVKVIDLWRQPLRQLVMLEQRLCLEAHPLTRSAATTRPLRGNKAAPA